MWLSEHRPPAQPRRIISLVPSQTELLHAIGLEEEVIGITRFCELPEHWYRSKTRIGGTKQVHLAQIEALQPDLILANKEENDAAQVLHLARLFPVWMTQVGNLPEALTMILDLGALCNKAAAAQTLSQNIQDRFLQWEQHLATRSTVTRTVVYLIWQDPWMSVGTDTFIHDLVTRAGFTNLLQHSLRYPVLEADQLAALSPDYLFLSSEPFPFQTRHMAAFQELLPDTRIQLVDGALFSWYGSRLVHTVDYFHQLHQDLSL
jgi:ABC-type Fe3+-hydroxamate transport system substrate-binding protein